MQPNYVTFASMAGLHSGPRGVPMHVPRGWWSFGSGGVTTLRPRAALAAALALGVAACSGGGSVNISNSQVGDPATLDYPIFYVKRTVPVDKGGNVVQDDLRVMRDAVPKADLYER